MVDSGRTVWSGVLLDTFVGYAARHAVRGLKPRAMYISYGETDDWAHEGSYDRYIRAAHEFDRFLGGLWQLCQSMPQYRDKTSFVIAADHGRGPAPPGRTMAGKSPIRPTCGSLWSARIRQPSGSTAMSRWCREQRDRSRPRWGPW